MLWPKMSTYEPKKKYRIVDRYYIIKDSNTNKMNQIFSNYINDFDIACNINAQNAISLY